MVAHEFCPGNASSKSGCAIIDPCPIGTIAREVANISEPLRVAAAKAFDSWVDAATRHLADAGIASEQAAQLAQVFVATVEGMFVLSRTQRSTAPLESAGRSLSQLVTLAIDETRLTRTRSTDHQV